MELEEKYYQELLKVFDDLISRAKQILSEEPNALKSAYYKKKIEVYFDNGDEESDLLINFERELKNNGISVHISTTEKANYIKQVHRTIYAYQQQLKGLHTLLTKICIYEQYKSFFDYKYISFPIDPLKKVEVYYKPIANTDEKATPTPPAKNVTSPFDYSNINKYFFTDKIEAFKQIENEMLQRDFFVNNKWSNKHPKYELAGFIHILYDLQYFKKQLKGKSISTSKLAYRRFFEQRYNTKISKEFQPQRIKNKLKLAQTAFRFIIPDLNTP